MSDLALAPAATAGSALQTAAVAARARPNLGGIAQMDARRERVV